MYKPQRPKRRNENNCIYKEKNTSVRIGDNSQKREDRIMRQPLNTTWKTRNEV